MEEPEKLALVVNDVPDQLNLMGTILGSAGYRVITAGDGAEGYELALSEHPDIIISDVSMPGVDGIELCRRVRAHTRLSSTPLLLVSAVHRDSESAIEGFRAGADDYLEAPYDPARLLAKASRLLECRRAEEALRASESELRALFAAMTDVVIELDAEGRYLKVAPTNPSHIYRPPADLVGKTLHDAFPEEQADFFLAHIRRALSEGRMHRVEYLLRLNGEELWFDGHVSPMSQDSVLWIARDITERKRVERKLRQSEERYRVLVENAHDLIYTHDLEGNYTSINKAIERVTGYTREEALGLNVAQLVAPEYREKARRMTALKLAGEPFTSYELEVIAKDGRRVKVEVNSSLVVQDGVPVGVQGIARDVTERKELEEQLRQAQKIEAVGKLAGGIAHDFNNLLTIINGYGDLTLRRLREGDPLRLNVEEMRKAGERAAGLTRQLLAFSRKQVLQPKVLDLNGVVTEMEKMLRRLIGEDIELRVALGPGLGSIKADPGQIEQVLLNLAVNARDAMPRGGKLTVSTENVYLDEGYAARHVAVVPGQYVMLAVSDTGAGMDEQTRARIFEPFFTTKEAGKGTGLGLSTIYGIVKQSGGYIWVYSKVGVGTSFKIYLPRVEEGPEEYRPSPEAEGRLEGTETVLLAEDEEEVRHLARQELELYGYRVLEASDGDAALLTCERHEGPIHLLITDVIMPAVGGPELAQRLTQLRPQMKVLFMSGYTDDAIVHHGVLDEGVNFIQKPFTPEALARKVREVLGAPA
ncbi:MAG: PAS domain S-box protein [Acidobacteriota bacterium]|nr:PAS domain S-box protein [Acidobacteriota bacterium]MDQ5835632.1 PAS domain S-box protein [Acidobacteriota bacterium]